MYKNQFQGGPFVEVFSCQGKDPLSRWKLTGSSIHKVYEKEVKSYVYALEGSSTTTRMQLPKDSRQTLSLVQRYLVVQLNTPSGAALSVELGVMDSSNSKRRLLFLTAQKEISITPLHVKLPLLVLRRGVWLNLCLDLLSVVGEAFRGQAFKSLDSITISASCRVRKIFTMKAQPQDSTDDDDIYAIKPPTNSTESDVVPRSCQFPYDVIHQTQVINMTKLRHAELRLRPDSFRPSSTSDLDLNSSMKSNQGDRPMHIAFGTKVPVPSSSHGRKESAGQLKEGCATSRSGRSGSHKTDPSSSEVTSARTEGRSRLESDPGSEINDPCVGKESKTLSTESTQPDQQYSARNPHPPSQKSGDKSRRVVKIRPNSGKSRTAAPSIEQDDTPKLEVEGNNKVYDPKRYTSRPRGDTWGDITRIPTVLGSKTENSELRTSTEVKVTSHFDRGERTRTASESSENCPITESDLVSDLTEESSAGGQSTGQRVKGDRSSRVCKKTKKAGRKKLGLMDSLSESEQVQYSLRRVPDIAERIDFPATDSGVGLTVSGGASIENVSSLDEDQDVVEETDRTEDDSSLYTFTSPPRSAPNRQRPGKTKHLDQKTLQAKLIQIQGSTSSAAFFGDTDEEEEDQLKKSLNGGDFTKSVLDESLSDDQYRSMLSKTPSPRAGHSPLPRSEAVDPSNRSADPGDGTTDSVIATSGLDMKERVSQEARTYAAQREGSGQKQSQSVLETFTSELLEQEPPDRLSENGSRCPAVGAGGRSHSPVRSRSPTMSKTKFIGSSGGGKVINFSAGRGDALQPLTSEVSPRGAERTLSRLSIHASKVKEITKEETMPPDEDWRNYKSNSSSVASSLEAKMLASLQREQLEELYEDENQPPAENSFDLHNYGDDDLSSSSDDTTTTFSTWKPPEVKKGDHRIQDEMTFPRNPLTQSNPRDWGSLFSPPIVLPSEKMKEGTTMEQLSPSATEDPTAIGQQAPMVADASSVGTVIGPSVTDDEEELDLLYDPCLNCYFDPTTGKYYKLA